MHIIDIKYQKSDLICKILCFDYLSVRNSLEISKNFLASLRLFVEKKYLRSRREPFAWNKIPKVNKCSNICT